MFSNPAETEPSRKRRWFYPAMVLLIWAVQLVCIIIFVVSIKLFLQQSIAGDMEESLKRFLSANQTLLHGQQIHAPLEKTSIGDFSFIRIIQNDAHLFFSASSDGSFDIRSIARFDPGLSGCWLDLDGGDGLRWNIVSVSPDSGLIIQAGRLDRSSYRLYRRIVKIAVAAAFAALAAAALIVYLSYRVAAAPLKRLESDLIMIQSDKQPLLQVSGTVPEPYRQIYDRIDRIIEHNRRLVNEMQASLDNVAHDLRTPMTRLRSVAEYGLQSGGDPETLQDALADCLEESERILAMLKIMMSVAEAESGMMWLETEQFRLDRQLEEVVELYEYLAEERSFHIITDIAGSLEISGDRTRLSQVWANLVDNAIKYGGEKGRLTISGRYADQWVEVVFSDTGIGISNQEIGKIWERLYRGDRSRTQPGLGLGLNYVKAVVDAHGGRIDVGSELNRGTTLTVLLPRDRSE